MKTLVVLRHAKTEQHAADDFARQLTDRGHEQGQIVAEQLRSHLTEPMAAIVSTARRAQQTWDDIAEALDTSEERVDADELYLAGGAALLQAVQDAPADASTVVLVGHNPGVSQLAEVLAGEPLDADGVIKYGALRTGSGVVLAYDGDWAELKPCASSLVTYVGPDALR
ncbi:hypothetical protein EK0264_06975 [Epidermidibacterium keratini]|uniref:Histidine phosphatase family protein n=1 Tax=Epidermidibacterium keratini TaxID=1891644 RepID=A0A7L4YMJ0_9ACTN|nr:histidine phosphatase family protein [Epidermidibacterium keratini]QHC00044.1 hypothetical protein EK0264_06975 [Epidermidibacterium keratini]